MTLQLTFAAVALVTSGISVGVLPALFYGSVHGYS
jgi:hypothetical protein